MTENQFKQIADTGDIILFRSNQPISSVTRVYSASHFDHVAMVLKFETDPDEVYLLEATGNLGVAINRWSFLREHIGKRKFYDKLVHRHLNFERGNSMIELLEKFLSQSVGQSYGLSAGKLLR